MAKKKKKKWVIVVVILLILVIAVCGVLYFVLASGKNAEDVKEYKKQVEQESKVMTDDLLSQISAATKNTVDEVDAEQASQDVGEGTPENPSNGQANPTGSSAKAPALSESEKIAALESRLETQYYNILLSQKSQALGMVQSLLGQAKSEYQGMAASGGKSPTALGDMMSRYLAKVDAMEGQMDASFNSLVGQMEQELTAQGIDSGPMITKFKAEYKTIKEQNRSAFMDMAWSQMK